MATRLWLGIILLARRMLLANVYDLCADEQASEAAAMSAVAAASLDLLRELLLCIPSLTQSPFVTAYLIAVLQVFEDTPAPPDDEVSAESMIRRAAKEGNDSQREAGAARLNRLAASQPAQADRLHTLAAELLRPTPQPDNGISSAEEPRPTDPGPAHGPSLSPTTVRHAGEANGCSTDQ